MTDATYNGSKNYETFTVSSELTNNRGLEGLLAARGVLMQLRGQYEYDFEVAEAFRDWFAESAGMPTDEVSLTGTACAVFLEGADWREIIADVDDEG